MVVLFKKILLMNGIDTACVPSGGLRHHLPQIPPVLSSNPKIAQSKASGKKENVDRSQSAVLHVEASGKTVSLGADGKVSELKAGDKSMDQTTRLRSRYAVKTEEALNVVETKPASVQVVAGSFASNVTSKKKAKVDQSSSKIESDIVSPRMSLEESDKPPKWLVGDLVWSKVSGHPWWPCLVAFDPKEGVYTRLRKVGRTSVRFYSVQYFYDEPERAWVSESSTLRFEGKERFFKYVEDMLERAPSKLRSQISQKYGVSKSRRAIWERAVRSAEVALPLTHQERKQRYELTLDKQQTRIKTEERPDVSKSKKSVVLKSKKQKTASSDMSRAALSPRKASVLNGTLLGKQKQNLPASSTTDLLVDSCSPQQKKARLSSSADQSSLEKRAAKDDGSFQMFCQKHREGVLSEHPDFDEQTVVESLRQQWSMMGQKQKARYKSKFGGGGGGEGGIATRGASAVADMLQLKRSGRISRPSIKKLEAEEDNKIFSVFRRRRHSISAVREGQPISTSNRSLDEIIDSVAKGLFKDSVSKQLDFNDNATPASEELGEQTMVDASQVKKEPEYKSLIQSILERPFIKEKIEEYIVTKPDVVDSLKSAHTVSSNELSPLDNQDSDSSSDTLMMKSKLDSDSSLDLPLARSKKRSSDAMSNQDSDSSSELVRSRKKLSKLSRGNQDSSTSEQLLTKIQKVELMKSLSNSQDSDSSTDQPLTKFRKVKSSKAISGKSLSLGNLDSDSSSDLQTELGSMDSQVKMEDGEESEDEEYELEIFKLSASCPVKRENVCQICEKPGDLIDCAPCQGSFHRHCLGLTSLPELPFKCEQCVSGVHTCFCCKDVGSDVRRCSVIHCGKFYHEKCVKKHPLTKSDGKSFTCPLHICVTCAADNTKNPKAVRGRLYRCLRCPTAFHVGDFCIAAGSVNLAGLNIICSNHYKPKKSKKIFHVNVSWCFMCNQGGTLLCCDSCPASFHAECLNISFPEGTWYCQDCAIGKKPLYGDIVWVKVGNYRWWPGEICHPKNVPLNIQQKPHQIGEFPVRFFGSHDYYWTSQARVFLFQEGDKGTRESSTAKGLAKIFKQGLVEATEAFQLWKSAKENRDQVENEKNDKKPAPFKFIKSNVPVGNVQIYKADLSEIARCECRLDMENPCGSDTECLNRMLMYECHPGVCPAGERCQNQRFQKRLYPPAVPVKTSTRGWGLKCLVDVKKGQFVNEYVGDLVDEKECRKRIRKAHEDTISNFYMLTLDKNRIIDAGPKGNLSRFMNHSCQPNCETQKWTVNGDVRVGLFALHDIPASTEMTFNYNLDCLGNEKKKCVCGAPNCSGFIGVRPKSVNALAEKKTKDVKKKRRRKKSKVDTKKEHDDECFRCGEGGELVMCDKFQCPKVYHLQCLHLTKPPHGRWTCPWHHCDECGKPATLLCAECPNSFCCQHSEGNMVEVNNKYLCADHEDSLLSGPNSFANGSCFRSDKKLSDLNKEHAAIMGQTESPNSLMEKATEQFSIKVTTEEVFPENGKTKENSTKRLISSNGEKSKPLLGRRGRKTKEDKRPTKVVSSKNIVDEVAKTNFLNSSGIEAEDSKKTMDAVSLAIPPMFDDSDDDFPDLVIDIPSI